MLEITFLKILRLVNWKKRNWSNTKGHILLSSLFSDFPSPIINTRSSKVHHAWTALDSKISLIDHWGDPDLVFHVCSEVKVKQHWTELLFQLSQLWGATHWIQFSASVSKWNFTEVISFSCQAFWSSVLHKQS